MNFAPFFRATLYLAGNERTFVKKVATKLCSMCSITESPSKLQLPEDASMERGHGIINSAMRNIFATSPSVSPVKKCTEAASVIKNNLAKSPSVSPIKKCSEAASTAPGSPAKLLLAPSLLQMMHIDLTQKQQTRGKKRKARPFTVSIEGNIGSGKSTFLNYFSNLPGVETHQEPLDLWTNLGGHNLLGKLYEDPKRWSFLFQSYVQLTRLNIHLQQGNSPVKLIERSLHNNRYCFVENGHDSGELQGAEYSVLCEYFDLIDSNMDIGIDLIVYLRSTPEIVHDRMMKRGRAEEAGVPLQYLKQVHNYYEKWLIEGTPRGAPAPVLIIDADKDLDTILEEYEQKKHIILGEVPMKQSEST